MEPHNRSAPPSPDPEDLPGVLEGLFAQSPSAYLVYGLDGRCVFANDACDRLFGGKPPPGYDIFQDEHAVAQGVTALIRKAFGGETVLLPPAWYDRRDVKHVKISEGRRVAVQVTLFPLLDGGGEVRHVVVHAREAAAELQLREAHEALRRREEELAATLRSIGDGVIATDARGRVVAMNPVAEQLTGWTLEEASSRPLEEVFVIVNEESREPVDSPVRQVIESGVVVGLANHTVLLARDGSERAIADSGAPIPGPDGAVQGVVLVFRDVSDERREQLLRREHAEELRRSEETLRAALRASRSLAWTLDFTTQKLRLSENTPDVLGAGPEHSVETFTTLVHPDDHEAVAASVSALARGQVPPDRAFRFSRPDTGEEVWLESRAHPIFDPEGRAVGATGHLVDVTERRRAEEALRVAEELRARSAELELEHNRIREASRLKSEFLAVMSHELRTPLNAIIGFAELLHDHQVEPTAPEHDEFLGDILGSARHLLHLINEILDLAKVEAGKLEVRPEPVDLAELVDGVCVAVRSISHKKKIQIETDADVSLGDVLTDPGRLKQILYNYLSNALKFTPDGGRVVVRTRPEGPESFRVEVEDTGIGIAPEDIGRLFLEFEQLESGAAKKHPGTGLGLALTRRLAHALGGSVGVRSELGRGSVFHAILPRRAPAAASGGPIRW